MKRFGLSVLAVLALAVALGYMTASTASAGEYSRGNGGDAARDIFWEKGTASICSFNGADEPDTTEDHGPFPGDDEDWAQTPAGGKVQSGGQIVATFGPDVVKGTGFGKNAAEGCNLKRDDIIPPAP